jgi:hypothetical protein
MEELFGVKRWRNDSPFIKEYIKVDNQICLLIILGILLALPSYFNYLRELNEHMDGCLTSNLGTYSVDDLI